MNELPKQYPFIHIYPQQQAHQPVTIKGNTEGLCVLVNALISAIANPDNNAATEVFCADAEFYEVVVRLVNTHEELSPLPYQKS